MSSGSAVTREASRRATEELLRELRPTVSKAVARFGNDEAHAKDLAQESLVRIAGNLEKCRDRDSIHAWAWRISVNTCISLRRADSGAQCVALDEAPEIADSAPPPDRLWERKRLAATVRRAVGKLPEREAVAIELVHLDGLSHAEAASRMGVGAEAVRRAMRRGLRHLRSDPEMVAWHNPSARHVRGAKGASARHPVLVLHGSRCARDRVRDGVRCGETSRLLDGVRLARGQRHLQDLVDRFPGCPVVVDPSGSDSAGSGLDALQALRARDPHCPTIAYGTADSCGRAGAVAETGVVAFVRIGVDDDALHMRSVLLRAADRWETDVLLVRLAGCVQPGAVEILDVALHNSVMRDYSVARMAGELGISARTLERRCRALGLPRPKRLLSLAIAFHVERLARWSECPRGSVALALGFPESRHYRRLLERLFGPAPTRTARSRGPEYVAGRMLREFHA